MSHCRNLVGVNIEGNKNPGIKETFETTFFYANTSLWLAS